MKKLKKLLLTAALAATMAVGAIVPAVTASATTYTSKNVDVTKLQKGDVLAQGSSLAAKSSNYVIFCSGCKVLYIDTNVFQVGTVVDTWRGGPHKNHSVLFAGFSSWGGMTIQDAVNKLNDYLKNDPYTVIGADGKVPHQHSFSTNWTIKDDGHYHACTASGCTIKDYKTDTTEGIAYAGHVYDQDGHKCVCGKEDPTHHHSFSTDWTITDDGHYYACTASGCTITDYTTDTTEGIAYAQHEYTNYENEVHKCVCGKEDPANTHTYDEATHKCDCGKVDPNYNPNPNPAPIVCICTIVKKVLLSIIASIAGVITSFYWIGKLCR